MNKAKLRSIQAFVLAIMLLLAGCQQPVADPQPPELEEPITAPAQPVPPAPEPQPTASEPPPEQVVEPPDPIRVWTTEETQAMEWPELFAALIHRFGEESIRDPHFFWDRWTVDSPWFALMDLNGDGQPELMFGSPSVNTTGIFYAVSAVEAEQFLLTETEDWERLRLIMGERPLRFFANESTSERMFSTVAIIVGGGFAYSIFYTDAQTLEWRWRIFCFNDGPETSSHAHRLDEWSENGWILHTTLEALPLDWREWWETHGNESGIAAVRPCDLFYGRNSSDPSTVALVNVALEGFTEVPAPAMHRFPGEFSWDDLSGADDVQIFQDWIFEVAAQWE